MSLVLLECVVPGVPISSQVKNKKVKNLYQQSVIQAVKNSGYVKSSENKKSVSPSPTSDLVKVTILYFSIIPILDTRTPDLDNFTKVILDALKQLVFIDDRQVIRLVVGKAQQSIVQTINQKPIIISALKKQEPFVYLAIESFKEEESIL